MRIGILGGTFNPIHNGHIHIAKYAYSKLNLDKILIIPTNIPPHKSPKDLADGVDRFNMCKLASRPYEYMEVSDIELKRDGASRTVDTLEQLNKIYPNDEFVLIMGSDMFLTFHEWYKYKEILALSSICVLSRNKEDVHKLRDHGDKISQQKNIIYLDDAPIIEMSSTDIRKILNGKQQASVYLCNDVQKYIDAVNLYIEQSDKEILLYKQHAKSMLSQGRYEHSINVGKQAVYLGIIYGQNLKNAYITGILHDIMKEKHDPNTLQMASDSVIICTGKYKHSKAIWHGILGSAYAEEKLDIKNIEILNAIRYHTSARKSMCKLEEVIYLADLTSFERNYPDLEIVRKWTELSLERGMLYALTVTIHRLLENQQFICDETWQAYNYYVEALMTH